MQIKFPAQWGGTIMKSFEQLQKGVIACRNLK